MKNILRAIAKSVYSPEYYRELLAAPASVSVKYFFAFAALLALITAAAFCTVALPPLKSFLDAAPAKVLENYPAGLVVQVKNGQVSTNVPQPYFIKMPHDLAASSQLRVNGSIPSDFENILTIDTVHDFSQQRFSSYHTAMLLTKDSIVEAKSDGTISLIQLRATANFTVDRPGVQQAISRISPFLFLAYPLLVLGSFTAFFLANLLKFAYLLVGALLIWLAARIKGIPIGYGKSYKLGLHLMTSAMLVWLVMGIFGIFVVPIGEFPFAFSILLFCMALLNLKKSPQPQVTASLPI